MPPPVSAERFLPCATGGRVSVRSAMHSRQPQPSASRYALTATQARRIPLCAPGILSRSPSVMHSRWLKPIGSSPSAALSVTSCHQSQLGAFTPSQAGGVDVLQTDQPVIVPQFAIACGHSSSAVVVLGLLVSWWCTVQEVQVF